MNMNKNKEKKKNLRKIMWLIIQKKIILEPPEFRNRHSWMGTWNGDRVSEIDIDIFLLVVFEEWWD